MVQVQPLSSSQMKEDETVSSSQTTDEKLMEKKPIPLMGFISMRLFITFLIVILLLSCSIFIWLASFIGSTNALQEMTKELIGKVGEKAVSYMNSEIEPQVKLSMSLAADISHGVIATRPPLVYLYEKYKIFKSSGLGVYFPNEIYAYSVSGFPPNMVLTYVEKQYEKGIIFWNVDESDGKPLSVYKNDSSTYQITDQPYWNGSFNLFKSHNSDVIIGEPYLVVNSGMAIFCSTKIYNSTALYSNPTQKQVIGIVKSNLMLNSIRNYLQQLTLVGNGYVILAELNDLVIGSSINTTSLDGIHRVSIFDMIELGSGQLMKDVRSKYGNLSTIPSFFQIESQGVGYDISKVDYKYLNIHWILYMVVYKSDIEKTTNVNTVISIGVAIGVMLLGIIFSFIIGHIVTKPLRFLENQFQKIKTFDLKSCHFDSSKFKEVDSIYEHLFDMVTWLNEFKSFLPENVFNQLQNFQPIDWKPSEKKQEIPGIVSELVSSKVVKSSALQQSATSSQVSTKTSSTSTASSIFKLGLTLLRVSVANVKIIGMSEGMTSPQDISSVFSRIANSLSNLCKTVQVADLHIIGVDEYQLTFVDGKKKCDVCALDASLKICKQLDNILGKSDTKISYSIGIFTDMAYVGNVGSNSLRFYSIVGPIVGNARKLAIFGQTLECKILVDSGSLSPYVMNQYVMRPVDRIEMEVFNSRTKHIISVHELLRENVINQDEWLYELEQSKYNSKFTELQRAFVSTFEVESNEANFADRVRETRIIFQRHADENQSDALVINRLIYVLNFLLDYCEDSDAALVQLVQNYRTGIHKSVSTISGLNYEEIPISHSHFK